MKLLKSVYGRLLGEVDLGEYEFAAYRKDLSKEQQGETDTLFEEQLYDALVYWVEYGKQPSVSTVDGLRDAMRDSRYSDFFFVPKSSEVYRGLSLSEKDFQVLMGDSHIDAVKVMKGFVKGDWSVSPRSKQVLFTSYSHDLEAATKFAQYNVQLGKEYAVVMTADVSENSSVLFDFYEVLKKLNVKFLIDVDSEREVIAMGPIKIREIRWQNMKEL